MQIAMGKIARAVRSCRFEDALRLMAGVWDGDIDAAAYALGEVFNVDVAAAYPWVTPRLP